MSRIYEALQKAESERKSERREPELPPTDEPLSAASTAVAEPEDAAFPTHRFDEVPIITEPYPQPPMRRMSEGSLDLSKIPARPWALSLSALPALLERGPAVEQFRSLR